MSKSYFMTPEEKMRKKKRDTTILYGLFIILTAILSSVLTILVN